MVSVGLAVFGVAALAFVVLVGGFLLYRLIESESLEGKKEDQSKEGQSDDVQEPRAQEPSVQGNDDEILAAWEQAKHVRGAPQLDLASVVDAMRKQGRSTMDVASELWSALDENPALLAGVAALPAALLRDDSVEMLEVVLCLLEERGQAPDLTAYAGLMAAQLRRRNYAGVAETAARLPTEALTPRMWAILMAAATQRGRLDEALSHMQQMPEPAEGAKSPIAPSVALQLLSLATREQRLASAAAALQRLRARVDTKQFEDLLTAESRRLNGLASCRELLEAGVALEVPQGASTYQALARAQGHAKDADGLCALLQELEAEAERGPTGIAVSEPLAMALLDACRVVRDADMTLRVMSMHRSACNGDPGIKALAAFQSTLTACDPGGVSAGFYQSELLRRGMSPAELLPSNFLPEEPTQDCQDGPDPADEAAPACSLGGETSSEIQASVAMIKAHGRERDLKSATDVFYRLQASGVAAPVVYNSFLDACVQCGQLKQAEDHFVEMKRLNLVDIISYNTLLKAYLSHSLTEEASNLMNEMRSRGLQATKVTYNELLHAKVVAKDRAGVWQHVEEMQAAGVRPNSVTCSILLKLLAANSNTSDLRRVIELMDQIAEPIDEVLFSSVIEACVRIKQLDLMSDLMRRYKQRGGSVSLAAPMYGSMIKAYGQAGDVARVIELWQEMEDHGVKPTPITLGCMVEALVANGEAQEAWDLVHRQLEDEEHKDIINTVIYSTVLKGFAVTRQVDRVFVVYKEMQAKDIPCNVITYNTLLDACAKCGAMGRVSQLLEDMAMSCVEPDIITYSTIVKGYCVAGDLDRAFSVLEDMQSDGKYSPDEIMYNSILDGCAKQHRVDDALDVLDRMKAANIAPSNYTLSILVKILGHARRLSQAFRMVEDLSTQNGFRPNVQVYTCLAQACIFNKKLERALSLHDTMVADVGSAIDEKFYAVLVRGCVQLHQPLKAVELVRVAYQLPGHSLAASARRDGGPVGTEARALEEVADRLRSGGHAEQQALEALNSDLLEFEGFSLSDVQSGKGAPRRRPAGKGGGGRLGRGSGARPSDDSGPRRRKPQPHSASAPAAESHLQGIPMTFQ